MTSGGEENRQSMQSKNEAGERDRDGDRERQRQRETET